jgi:hypothetical protein
MNEKGGECPNPRELAASFALVVTEPVQIGSSWIAKNGDESLFRTFQSLLPQVFFDAVVEL